MKSVRTPRQVDPERLKSHELWRMSKKGIGERLVLTGDYRGANLEGCDLREARIEANLRGANLSGAKLNGADLEGAILWDSDLVKADLTGATGLLPTERTHGFYPLSGADLQGAILPENIREFPAIGNIIALCRSAGALFLALIAGDAVIQLMTLKATDLQLITNTGTASIPILNTEVPTSTLFWVGPVVLLISYLALLFYMQKLWELIASLPAVFPDGLLCSQKAYPWMAAGMMGSCFPKLGNKPRSLPSMERFLYTGLIYYLVPLSFLPIYCRYLVAHDWRGTAILITIIGLCAFYWWIFVCLASAVLTRNVSVLKGVRGALTRETLWSKSKLLLSATIVALSGVGLALLLARNGPFGGERPIDLTAIYNGPPWSLGKIVPNILTFLEISPFVNLRERDLSRRPPNWAESPRLEYITNRADLKGRDLSYGDLRNAFVVNGDLQGATLAHCNLDGADLRGANLAGIIAPCASLMRTHFVHADLSRANLEGDQLSFTDFSYSNLQATNFAHARITHANFEGALLRSACFIGSEIINTSFTNARFGGIETTAYDSISRQSVPTYADAADLSGMKLEGSTFEGAHMEGVNFTSASLAGVNLSHASLNSSVLKSADLRGADIHAARLDRAKLYCADLRFSNLTSAQLSQSDLRSANVRYSVLRGADLRGANLAGAVFTNAILTGAKYNRQTRFPAFFRPYSMG